jgi:HSP20 family protein
MKDQPGTLQQQQPEIPEPQQQSQLAKTTTTSLKLSPIQEFMLHMQELRELIARRAYELFEKRGYAHGQDSEDWLKAESEILRPVRMEVTDTPDSLIARSRVSGFEPSQLSVSVEPQKLAVAGRREISEVVKAGEEVRTTSGSVQFLEVMDLPAQVDPTQATATLKGDVLEVTLPKVAAGEASESTKRPKARTQAA